MNYNMYSKFMLEIGFIIIHVLGPVNGQCNMQGVNACIPSGQPSTDNQCEMFRTLRTCLEPFKAGCESDSTFQTMMAGFDQLGALCSGSSGSSGGEGQCDMVGVGKCMEGVQSPSPDTKDLQTACASFNEVLTCIKRYESDCASLQAFQQAKGAIDAVTPFCAGGAACNPMKCFTDAGLDISSNSMPNLTCDVSQQVKKCMDLLSAACEGNALYPTLVQAIKKEEQACSQKGPVNGQCNMQGVSACMSSGQPSTDNQCEMFRTLQTCLEPFKAGCESDSTFQTMTAGFAQLGPICDGSSGSSGGDGQCDMVGVGKCMEGVQLPSPDTKDLQTACASFNEVLTCIKRYESDCASLQAFQQAKGVIDAVAPYCAGGAACNSMKCFTDAGLDISSNSMPNITCDVIQQVKTCMDLLSTACEGNALYPTLVQAIQKGEQACSQKVCDFQACNIDHTFPIGVPSKMEYERGCTTMNNAIACLKTKCPGDKMVESVSMGYDKFCKDSSIKTGLATYKDCLASTTVNQDCQKHFTPDMQGGKEESEEEECQRIAMYSMCAKKAVSKCDSEGAEAFTSETARKIITLKTKREGGIKCSTGGAPSTMPALWTLLSAALVTLAAIL
ncbi:uncharacterized protein LOC125678925 isoform X2 [Ostrea edulis]|uniref:uncharacterized protein LOC125678925 isoform X2 n=1 Tax=Ostrea edulis TaxID=37623 RepID=UPI0024AEEC1A|nr:uncharacterized protein LOC125678925 isoform X2 [Ostrea edulis]